MTGESAGIVFTKALLITCTMPGSSIAHSRKLSRQFHPKILFPDLTWSSTQNPALPTRMLTNIVSFLEGKLFNNCELLPDVDMFL